MQQVVYVKNMHLLRTLKTHHIKETNHECNAEFFKL